MPFIGGSNDSNASFRSLKMKLSMSRPTSRDNQPASTRGGRRSYMGGLFREATASRSSSVVSYMSSASSLNLTSELIDFHSLELDDLLLSNYIHYDFVKGKLSLLKKSLKSMKEKLLALDLPIEYQEKLFSNNLTPNFLLNTLEDITLSTNGQSLSNDEFISSLLKLTYFNDKYVQKPELHQGQHKNLIDNLAVPYFHDLTYHNWAFLQFDAQLPCIIVDCIEPFSLMSVNSTACQLLDLESYRDKDLLEFICEYHHHNLIDKLNSQETVHRELFPFLVKGKVKYFYLWAAKVSSSISINIQECKDINLITCSLNLNDGSLNELTVNEKKVKGCELLSGLSGSLGELFQLEKKSFINNIDKINYFTIKQNSKNIPSVLTSYEVKDNIAFLRLANTSFETCLLIVNSQNLRILNCGNKGCLNIFGWNKNHLIGKSISTLIPAMQEMLYYLLEHYPKQNYLLPENQNMILPEHFIRKLNSECAKRDIPFYMSSGLEGLHRDDSTLKIDVNLQVVDSNTIFLYVTQLSDSITLEIDNTSCQLNEEYIMCKMAEQTRLPSLEKIESFSNVTKYYKRDKDDFVKNGLYKLDSNLIINLLNSPNREGHQYSHLSNSPSIPSSDALYLYSSTEDIGQNKKIKKFSDYIILQELGEGAYGKVFICFHKKQKYIVIIKIIYKNKIQRGTWVNDKEFGRIPTEISVMVKLNRNSHDNTLKLLDFFEDEDSYYIECPVHGETGSVSLSELIESQPNLSEFEIKLTFKQTVAALMHLHEQGIIHRDIKEENIIVNSNGHIKMIDFGSAAFSTDGPFDMFLGTVEYTSPEILMGEPYEGKPQDIWSLGILLYTMVFKEIPFSNVDEIIGAELDFNKSNFSCSDDCIELIRKMASKRVTERPTIQEVYNDKWLQI